MSHEGYPHYASYESYSMMQSSAGLYYDYSRPKLTPGGRETRYVMLEINGKPTPVPCYSIEDYGFADTATNAPLPGETPEETLARRKKDDIRMKRYTELLQRRSQTYAQSTTLPPSAMTQTPVHPSLSHHYTTGPAHWQVQQVRHPVSDSSSGSQHHQLPMTATFMPLLGHSSWQSEHQGNNPVFLHQPALTIDTQVQIQSSGDDQYSSHSSTSDSWRSPAPESPRNYFTDGSFPPETPTEKSASPSLPTPSTPVDLLSLPPRNRDSPPSSGSPAPKADTRTNSAKAAAYDQLLTYRPIGPKRKDHEAKASPARPPFASQIPTAESVVVNIPKPRQKANDFPSLTFVFQLTNPSSFPGYPYCMPILSRA
ncbi:hypothetical protein DL96DRAFT_1707569 [Flagelloscypha sp. PMI_526]|nr:hypothetical protein DL96DRAFT_1707569 [Flagelloscypha sp. PMI_526]